MVLAQKQKEILQIERRRREVAEYNNTQQQMELQRLQQVVAKQQVLPQVLPQVRPQLFARPADGPSDFFSNVSSASETSINIQENNLTISKKPDLTLLNTSVNTSIDNSSTVTTPISIDDSSTTPDSNTVAIKQEEPPTTVTRLHASVSSKTRGTKKRPILLDSDEEEDGVTEKSMKIENANNNNDECVKTENDEVVETAATPVKCTKKNVKDRIFKLSTEELTGIDEDILDDLKKQTVSTLGLLLAKRSQSLRNMRTKVCLLLKSLTSVDLPDTDNMNLNDTSIDDLLDKVLKVNTEDSDIENTLQ